MKWDMYNNDGNNNNNILTYNKLYAIVLCSLHAMCQNILHIVVRCTSTHSTPSTVLYTHIIIKNGILCRSNCSSLLSTNPFSSLLHNTHSRHTHHSNARKSLETKIKKKNLLCGFMKFSEPDYRPTFV